MRLRFPVVVLVVLLAGLAAVAGNSAPKYQAATILQVAKHQGTSTASKDVQYDIVIRVNEMIYVVLYTPKDGLESVEYHGGQKVTVSVGKKTIKFNDVTGRTREVPILSSRKAPPNV